MSVSAATVSRVLAPTISSGHILVVDDDPIVRCAVLDYLTCHDYRVTAVADGSAMKAVLESETIDLVIMDVRLQREDGLMLASHLREDSAVPIIMLTARNEEADRVMGLELAADDYVTKPFSPRELLARIRAVLRRRLPDFQQGRPEGIRAYLFDGWELNLHTRRLRGPDGRIVPLSNGEFSLLVALVGAAERILTRDQLLDMSRLHGDDVYNRSVNTQIMRLRRKLEDDPAEPRYICTERGLGYAFSAKVGIVY
jgi:two-component system OmpR family response regulator